MISLVRVWAIYKIRNIDHSTDGTKFRQFISLSGVLVGIFILFWTFLEIAPPPHLTPDIDGPEFRPEPGLYC